MAEQVLRDEMGKRLEKNFPRLAAIVYSKTGQKYSTEAVRMKWRRVVEEGQEGVLEEQELETSRRPRRSPRGAGREGIPKT